jgi:hypothetical protein
VKGLAGRLDLLVNVASAAAGVGMQTTGKSGTASGPGPQHCLQLCCCRWRRFQRGQAAGDGSRIADIFPFMTSFTMKSRQIATEFG